MRVCSHKYNHIYICERMCVYICIPFSTISYDCVCVCVDVCWIYSCCVWLEFKLAKMRPRFICKLVWWMLGVCVCGYCLSSLFRCAATRSIYILFILYYYYSETMAFHFGLVFDFVRSRAYFTVILRETHRPHKTRVTNVRAIQPAEYNSWYSFKVLYCSSSSSSSHLFSRLVARVGG